MANATYDHIVMISGLGPAYLHINRRARRIIIRLDDDGAIRVTVPYARLYPAAIDFVLSRRDWILAERERKARGEPELPPLPYEPPPMDRETAAAILEPRLRELATRHRLTVRQVRIKEQKTIWGSCASGGIININWKTARLPDHLRDYVLLHELAHLRYRNHRTHFWHLLDQLVNGDARTLDRELRNWPLKLL